MKTSLLRQEDIKEKTDADACFMSGYSVMLLWLQTLEKDGFNLRTTGAIMEFGCVFARLIRHLHCMDGVRVVASDVDAHSIE